MKPSTSTDHGNDASLRIGARNLEYYGQPSPGRDDYWQKMAAPRLRVQTFLRLLSDEPAASLVDLGCGDGRLLSEVRRRYPSLALCGIDFAAPQIAANRQLNTYVEWHEMDLDREVAMPTAMLGRFDVVVASEIIEHLAHPEAFLRNALLLAATGRGRLLLSTQSGPLRETERRVGHLQHFSVPAIERLLRESGWEPLRVWNCGFPFHDLSKWYANRDPDKSMQRFAEASYGWREDIVCWALRAAFRINSRRTGAQLFAVARRA